MAITDGYYSLGADINKVSDPKKTEQKEGASVLIPELELSMNDEELISLAKEWKELWDPFWTSKRKPKCDKNEKYWKGETRNDTDWVEKDEPLADNVIFSALETFLPMATRQNPDPVVTADNTEEGNALAEKVKLMLVNIAKKNDLKIQLKQLMRFWSLYELSAAKIGWSNKNNDISLAILRPHKLILDPNASIVNGEYTGEYIGEYRKDSASRLIRRFPKREEFIRDLVEDKMGTQITYIEWWTDDYVFWTVKGRDGEKVLNKAKNPHWNYDTEESKMDEFGNTSTQQVTGRNQFKSRRKPYEFFSVYNLGLTPFDETGLVQQSISTQDLINKRLKQIDRNADATNGGAVVSGEHFTKEQAGQVAGVLRDGGTIFVPSGSVGDAYKRDMAPALPQFVYQSLQDYRAVLRETFGVIGSTAGSLARERTVRGKVLEKTADLDRVGNGISEYLEQVSEKIYDWFVQMMFVYYDEPHTAAVMGKERALEYVTLVNTDLNREITVTVKEGSLLPKDSVSESAQAIELYSAGALDPITLFDKLEFSDPYETAKQLFIWKTNPAMLFPDLAPPAPMAPPGGAPAPGGAMQAPPPEPPAYEGAAPQLPPIQ